MSILAPRIASGLVGERRSDTVNLRPSLVLYMHLLRCSPIVAKRPPTLSPPSKLKGAARVAVRPPELSDRKNPWELKKRDIKRSRQKGRGQRRKRERAS